VNEPPVRPRIAFVGVSPAARGGIAQFGTQLARVLHGPSETTVLAYRRLYPRFTRPGRQGPDPSAHRPEVAATSILVPWLPWTWRAAAREVERFRADLVVIQWFTPILGPSVGYMARRARRAGTRVVALCHNHRPHEPFPLWRRLTRRALAPADLIVTFSRAVEEPLRGIVPDADIRTLKLPPLVDVGRTRDDSVWRDRLGPLHGPVVLFFGNVRAYKGLADLIDAFPLVRRWVDATLVVAGTFFEPLERYRRQAEVLGVEGAIRFFPDYVANEDVPGLFALADVVALPYRSAEHSGVLAQAALAGRPVVATAVGELPETLGDRGVIVPPGDPPALAEGLIRALENPPPPPAPHGDWERFRELLLREAAAAPRLVSPR
jgi:glycosyltransferase involved in cell wall biosynthesis